MMMMILRRMIRMMMKGREKKGKKGRERKSEMIEMEEKSVWGGGHLNKYLKAE